MRKTTLLLGIILIHVAMGRRAAPALRAQAPAADEAPRLLRVLHEPLAGPAALSAPAGIALAPDGRVAVLTVLDGVRQRIAFFDAQGEPIDLWPLETGGQPLQDPWDLEFAPDGSLLVGSRGFVNRWRDGPRNVLTEVLAAYFETYRGRFAGSAELLEVLERELPVAVAAEGGTMTAEEAVAFVDAWAADWVY